MTWFINFCAPFLPNDPTINFHRYVQGACLLILTLIYLVTHIYYKICAPTPLTSDESTPKGISALIKTNSNQRTLRMEAAPSSTR